MPEPTNNTTAQFYALSSYGIPERLYFVLLGTIQSGNITDGMYAKITLNSSLNLSVKIHEVTRIEFPGDNSVDTLLIIYCDDKEFYDFLLALNVNSETVKVEIDGED
jgi:hypothetical protein